MPEATLCVAVGQLRGGVRHAPVSHHRCKSGHSEGCALDYWKTALRAGAASTRTARTKHTPQRPPKGLKGRFQQSQVRKHLERRA